MRTLETDDQPQLSQPLEYPDRGIIRDLAGKWAYIDHGLQVLAVITLLGWLLVGRVELKA